MPIPALAPSFPVLLAAAVSLAGPLPPAEVVVREGEGIPAFDRRIDALLAAGDFLLVTRDTLIARQDTVPRSVLVLDASLILEGDVAGDLLAVGANVFLRPTARIRGDAINLAGGLYRSEQAMIAGTIEDHPLAPYRVIRSDGTVRIQGIQAPAGWELAWPFGLRPPTYDRVDGLTLRWEGSYGARLWRGGRQTVRGSVAYRTERSAPAGGLEIAETRGGTRVAIGARRETDTNDRWIRGNAYNSLTFLTTGRDYRDYFEADRLYATVERDFEGTRIRGSARLRAQLERARSLAASDPWTLFGGEPRSNPPIDPGTIASAILGGSATWFGSSAVLDNAVELEFAGNAAGGDVAFSRFLVTGRAAMRALANHALRVRWRFQGPLPGTEDLPRQRWMFVGGEGTLPTFSIARFRGDRLVFTETRYGIPLPDGLALPVIGAPDFELVHAVGMAWTADDPRDFEQNVGVGLRFPGFSVRAITNPEAGLRGARLSFLLESPVEARAPWEQQMRSTVRSGFDSRPGDR